MSSHAPYRRSIRKLLVANRSEIAIRVFRAAAELGMTTVAIYAEQDKLALHRFKSDEAYPIGHGLGPIDAYLSIPEVIRVATESAADAVHPGYGFLAENPDFAEACAMAGLTFIGPSPATMRQLGNKVAARDLAVSVGIPVMPATGPLPHDLDATLGFAHEIGYPLMLKASWGGGGRGMRVIHDDAMLHQEVPVARAEAKAAFGNDEIYLEKLVERARHVEVQVLGDKNGNLVHLYERDCTVQRRHQKIVERAPAPYLDDARRTELCEYALAIARSVRYVGAGTVEFLMDVDTGRCYFIEVNPRIQVEHTVTEQVTGVDLVKAQLRIAEGEAIGTPESGVPAQDAIRLNGHALQCRITTEDPESNFRPDYGRITAYRGAMGFGIRLDGGTAYSGAVITRHYDALLEKVTAWAPTPDEACRRMGRALREFRIRGVATNLAFLENVIDHPKFRACDYTTTFIDETPELFEQVRRKDRASKLLTWIADVTVNGHPETRGRPMPHSQAHKPALPHFSGTPAAGARQRLEQLGPGGFAEWMRNEQRVLVTDTTMRDAHQSLLATRMRTYDIVAAADAYAHTLPQLLSLECWGGATFDVAMRFLTEDPWERLRVLRERVPNILLQMLLRGANCVGYANYPDNVVKFFVRQAAGAGVDLFRIFDALNWIENMRAAIDAVLEAGRIAEGTICYTGDMLDPTRPKYDLRYYVALAKALESAGCHVLGIKDMAGVLKPAAARILVQTLKQEVGLPIHFHTHDTSGISAASVLAAVEVGVDAVDAAMDSLSGLTSQPCLGSIVAALRGTDRDTGLDAAAIRQLSDYWEAVRAQYRAFEPDLRSGASEVYLHEMPGGQFTNLKEQARALGLENRWHEVAQAYSDVNRLFGDIVKVTPTSKVVGDMALAMVSSDITPAQVADPEFEVAFPESVVQLFRGDLGQPPGGWPQALQAKVLKGESPSTERAGARLAPVDFEAARAHAAAEIGCPTSAVNDDELASYLMYPKIFVDYAKTAEIYGPTSVLSTPAYFYGVPVGEELHIELERGKTMVVLCQAIGETDEHGQVKQFFEVNGQPRIARVPNRSAASRVQARRKADDTDSAHVSAPMPGFVVSVAVQTGQSVKSGDLLLSIEAMKMQTAIHARRDGTVAEVLVQPGSAIEAKDLLVVYAP